MTLSEALVEVLARVVPHPFVVSTEDGAVCIACPTVWWAAASHVELLASQPDGEIGTNLETAAWNALSLVQDYISEVTAEPWPQPVGATRRQFLDANARVVGNQLQLEYARDSYTVPLPAIALRDIQLPEKPR